MRFLKIVLVQSYSDWAIVYLFRILNQSEVQDWAMVKTSISQSANTDSLGNKYGRPKREEGLLVDVEPPQ